jgi:cellulose synthase/poly-beta-1,6-N-acetylglucosamine synthase-like glycosyltransferase
MLPVSIIVPAHNEEAVIESKIANLRALDYASDYMEIIVASDGSSDRTVELALRAGAHSVLDLPRIGKISALNRAVRGAKGEILVFTDADSLLFRETLRELISNFADAQVGCVAANEINHVNTDDGPVARGEGMYWRYEQWIKRLEARIGSTVSASGRLYAIRRDLFHESGQKAGTDDFLISTEVVKSGYRLVFDEHARVMVVSGDDARVEIRRKVRVMNRGIRAAMTLGVDLWRLGGSFYPMQLFSHKILRRFTGFLLMALLLSTAWLALVDAVWWLVLAPQLLFYSLAVAGALLNGSRWSRSKIISVPYFFCLANWAATLAVLSWLGGARFETWEPIRPPRRPALRSERSWPAQDQQLSKKR